ncbi:MAG: arginine--tRNA ligase [Clostridiales Family XIII bacterium]|jgi:arginyl-tRNA synthetase|nr:arginine--tRNA ligase [Clostridiales Family XIII bacterium]
MRDFKNEIAALIAGLPAIVDAGLDVSEVFALIEIPPEASKGDYAFPCFRLSKALRKAPQQIAAELTATLADAGILDVAEGAADGAAKSGGNCVGRVVAESAYVNFFLRRDVFSEAVVNEVRVKSVDYGKGTIGNGRKVIVEFSSPNIAKPFHIGHIRSTVIGNAIEHIYSFLGYDTVRINHLGDYGTQFGKMIVAYRRWGNRADVERAPIQSLLSYYTKFHEEAALDPSLEDEAREVFAKLENGGEEELALWKWFREESLGEFGRVYKMLGIEFDSYAGESFYSDKMDRVTDELKAKGLLLESEGAQVVDLSQWDMPPALIRKSDGSTLYITRDIAAAIYRKEHYDFEKNIYVVASQQNLHFKQWFKVVELMGYDWASGCVHVPFGLVSLEDGVMSTREGRVVFLEDVLNRAVSQTREIIVEKNVSTDNIDETARQVGIGAVVFNELANNRIKDYVFSWDKVLNFEGETGPYVQYVHARAASVLRKAEADAVRAADPDTAIDGSYLGSDSAYELARLIYKFPAVIMDAGEKYEPSVVTRLIVDIAQTFNRFYHDEYILVDDAAEKIAKLALVYAVKQTVGNGLALLGIEAPERM